MNALPTIGPLRADLQLISDMIEPNSRVLDVGCGDGAGSGVVRMWVTV